MVDSSSDAGPVRLIPWWELPQPVTASWAGAIAGVARAAATATAPTELFDAIAHACQAVAGWRLLTVLLVDPERQLVRRTYTSNPDAYPVGGTKSTAGSDLAAFLSDGRASLMRTPAELARMFPDHELIASLGCGAAMNVPVQHHGVVLGSVNVLGEAGAYEPAQVAAVGPVAQYAAATLRELRP
ncbi:MAG: GAF domain-containing protein [Nocardioides sp.]|uniref:GAF domain-containing protein n=1 Tax=Nocardioides sp. TaxID=35761 RepID=UPI0039E400FE